MTRTVCIIPARGGSARIPRKNIALFHGKPMLQWAIERAQRSRLFDEIMVSTDDPEIGAIAENLDCGLHRRPIDDGTRGTQEIARDVLLGMELGHNIACVLYPCTPLLTIEELIQGYRRLHTYTHDGPMFVRSGQIDGTKAALADAGGYYWGWAFAFENDVPLEQSCITVPVRYHFDINTPEDWARAEQRYAELTQ